MLRLSGEKYSPNDFIAWLPKAPVVSQAAKEVIETLSAQVEFLPLFVRCKRQFFAMNVLEVTDELDFPRSDLVFCDETEESILMIRSAVFDFKSGPVPPIFKLKRYTGDVFVSSEFARLVRSVGLTGAKFLDPTRDVFSRVVFGDIADDFK